MDNWKDLFGNNVALTLFEGNLTIIRVARFLIGDACSTWQHDKAKFICVKRSSLKNYSCFETDFWEDFTR